MLSLKQVLETLACFDLKQSDVKVYVFLAKKGPHTGKDISNMLNMPRWQLYQCLRNLEGKGVVSGTPERPALFSAVPFEKVIDLIIKAKLEEAEHAQQNSHKALLDWKSMADNLTR
jgi:sugar-specific transcriptional regulator TrmB